MIIEYWRSEEDVFFNWDKIILDLQDPLVDCTTSQYHLITQPPYPTDGLVPLNLANLNFLTNIALTQPIELNIHTAFMQQLNALLVPANGLFSAEEPHSLGEIGLDLDSYLQALAAQATQATQATGITFDQQNQAAPPPPKPRSRGAARRVNYDEYASSADEGSPSVASEQSSHKRDPALNSTQLADLVSTLRDGQAFSPKQTRLLGSSSLAVYSKVFNVPGITPEIHEELRVARRKIRNRDSAKNFRNKRAEYKTSMEQKLGDALERNTQLESEVARLTAEKVRLSREIDVLNQALVMEKARVAPIQSHDPKFFTGSQPNHGGDGSSTASFRCTNGN